MVIVGATKGNKYISFSVGLELRLFNTYAGQEVSVALINCILKASGIVVEFCAFYSILKSVLQVNLHKML